MVTINRAVDHLIDVLAGEDVPVVGSKATRVDQLANMIADGEIVIGGGGGGYDLVIELNHSNPDEVTGGRLVSGSYAAACEKALGKQPVTALVYGLFEDGSKLYMVEFISFTEFNTYVPEGEDYLLYVFFSNLGDDPREFRIASDDSVIID